MSLLHGPLSLLGLITVLIPLPLLVLQLAGAVTLARRLPHGSRRSLGVAAFAVGALATLVWLTASLTARLAPRIQYDLQLPTRQIALVLDLMAWAGGLIAAAAVLLVLIAMLKTSGRSQERPW